jgi:general secretion pathway protein G
MRTLGRLLEMVAVLSVFAFVALNLLNVPMPWVENARRDRAEEMLEAVAECLEEYRASNGQYPATEDGLDALFGSHPDPSPMPGDPWGNEIRYESDGADYRLACLGADGLPGGTGYDADVIRRGGFRTAADLPR